MDSSYLAFDTRQGARNLFSWEPTYGDSERHGNHDIYGIWGGLSSDSEDLCAKRSREVSRSQLRQSESWVGSQRRSGDGSGRGCPP